MQSTFSSGHVFRQSKAFSELTKIDGLSSRSDSPPIDIFGSSELQFTPYLYIYNFFIIHLKVALHSFVFSAFVIPRIPYIRPLVPPLFDRPSNIWRRVTNHEAVIMQLYPVSCYFHPLPRHTQSIFFPEYDRSNSTLTDI